MNLLVDMNPIEENSDDEDIKTNYKRHTDFKYLQQEIINGQLSSLGHITEENFDRLIKKGMLGNVHEIVMDILIESCLCINVYNILYIYIYLIYI